MIDVQSDVSSSDQFSDRCLRLSPEAEADLLVHDIPSDQADRVSN